ncbi:MAG TPA: GlsB/YeaQ/YmgE family stress response membrane protein [Candidatus Acidoferrum sp.]|nr:GlsB/YeaQ/YmgE family stress response membrane protein [Candidatus Acidoferrum sp.]
MYLLAWIFIGVLVGWGAGRILQGNGYGPIMDVAMGIGGAVAGGLLMRAAGFGGVAGTIITAFVAVISAALLTVLFGVANGRRIYARQRT